MEGKRIYLDREVDLTEHALFGPPRGWGVLQSDSISIKDTVESGYKTAFGIINKYKYVDFPWNDTTKTINSDADFTIPREFNNELFDYLGFSFYGDVDEPMIMGDVRYTQGKKDLLEQEYGGYCHRCGAKPTVFDPNRYDMCNQCEIETDRNDNIFEYLIRYEVRPEWQIVSPDRDSLALIGRM